MAVQGPTSSSGIPESPLLRSALTGQTVTAGRAKESTPSQAVDRAETSNRIATALRQNNASAQQFQNGVTETRIALKALEQVQNTVERFLATETSDPGEGVAEHAAHSIRSIVDRASFGGRQLLSDLRPQTLGLDDKAAGDPRQRLTAAVGRISSLRNRFVGELETHMKALASAEVERANLVAASGTESVASSSGTGTLLREASARLGPDNLQAASGDLDPARVIRIL
jgi:hypothetical protein